MQDEMERDLLNLWKGMKKHEFIWINLQGDGNNKKILIYFFPMWDWLSVYPPKFNIMHGIWLKVWYNVKHPDMLREPMVLIACYTIVTVRPNKNCRSPLKQKVVLKENRIVHTDIHCHLLRNTILMAPNMNNENIFLTGLVCFKTIIWSNMWFRERP